MNETPAPTLHLNHTRTHTRWTLQQTTLNSQHCLYIHDIFRMKPPVKFLMGFMPKWRPTCTRRLVVPWYVMTRPQ